MSEIGEIFAATRNQRKQASRDRKSRNMEGSIKLLNENNINYEVKNGGVHIVINGLFCRADFYPTTGKFIVRGDKRHFRGVRLLIKIVRGDFTQEQFSALKSEK